MRLIFSNQIGFLERTTDLVLEMVRALRKEGLNQIKELNTKLQGLESEADVEMMRSIEALREGWRIGVGELEHAAAVRCVGANALPEDGGIQI